jgi:hypothetical protein
MTLTLSARKIQLKIFKNRKVKMENMEDFFKQYSVTPHYNCDYCTRSFTGDKLLKFHILGVHMKRCEFCKKFLEKQKICECLDIPLPECIFCGKQHEEGWPCKIRNEFLREWDGKTEGKHNYNHHIIFRTLYPFRI